MRKGMMVAVVSLLAAGLAGAQETKPRGCGRAGFGLEVVGLTADQRLVCFNERLPLLSREIGEVTGLIMDARIVGIDYRPATGDLYGLGDAGGVYILDARNGDAAYQTRLNKALRGISFGIDFNPTVDRLRIISDAGQNLRADVTTGATTEDTDLTIPPATAVVLGVAGAGYTNNDADPMTATTLYDIDSTLDQVAIQSPPNQGELAATGKLRVDASSAVGFDIYTHLQSGTTAGVTAFASLTSSNRARFYQINLITGRASLRGSFRFRDQVVDIAVPLAQE